MRCGVCERSSADVFVPQACGSQLTSGCSLQESLQGCGSAEVRLLRRLEVRTHKHTHTFYKQKKKNRQLLKDCTAIGKMDLSSTDVTLPELFVVVVLNCFVPDCEVSTQIYSTNIKTPAHFLSCVVK